MWDVVKKIIAQRKKKELEPMLKILEELSAVEGTGPDAENFVQVVRDIKLFSNKANATLDKLVQSDSNWFVKVFMNMI